MHYCYLVITKEKPDNAHIESLMDPYYEADFYEGFESLSHKRTYPAFLWDYWLIGGRFSDLIETPLGRCDQAIISETTKIPAAYGFILPTGEARVKSWWTGEMWVDNKNYESELADAIRTHYNDWVTVLDIHD